MKKIRKEFWYVASINFNSRNYNMVHPLFIKFFEEKQKEGLECVGDCCLLFLSSYSDGIRGEDGTIKIAERLGFTTDFVKEIIEVLVHYHVFTQLEYCPDKEWDQEQAEIDMVIEEDLVDKSFEKLKEVLTK